MTLSSFISFSYFDETLFILTRGELRAPNAIRFYDLPLRVTDLPGLEVMTAKLSHPEGSSLHGYRQAKPKVQAFDPGDSLLEHHDLSDNPSGHDESSHYRREDALFAACEDQHSGDERTPSDANRQEKGGNGVIAEWRVLEPFQREPALSSRFYQDAVLIGAEQQDYAPPIADSALNAAGTRWRYGPVCVSSIYSFSCSSCSCGVPGGVTIGCQVEQACQGDPEPAPPGHTSSDGIDEDVGQGGNRQEEDAQQRQEPAPVKCTVDQRGREPDDEQCHAGE